MKKIYGKPSMAVNSFVTADSTNAIEIMSSVAYNRSSGRTADRYGISILDLKN